MAHFSNKRSIQCASLPGSMLSVTLRERKVTLFENLKLNLHWTHENYDKYVPHSRSKFSRCDQTSFVTQIKYRACFRFAYAPKSDLQTALLFTFPVEYTRESGNHVIYRTPGGQLQLKTGKACLYQRLSWNRASQLCRDTGGGYLPHFTSNEALRELIAFFKLSQYLAPIEAICIGLRYNKGKQVSFTNFHKQSFVCILFCFSSVLLL